MPEVRFSPRRDNATVNNIIMVYDFYTCEKVIDLRGHNSKVKSLHWGADDSTIVSCGADGAVYQWDWEEGKRLGEFVQKGTTYLCALSNAESVFAVGTDQLMKELEVPELQVVKELDGGVVLGQIALSSAEHMMFAGTCEEGKPGCVRAYSFPLTGDYLEYACLGAPIERMRITHDDQDLVVTDRAGCVCIFDVKDRQDRSQRAGAAAGRPAAPRRPRAARAGARCNGRGDPRDQVGPRGRTRHASSRTRSRSSSCTTSTNCGSRTCRTRRRSRR